MKARRISFTAAMLSLGLLLTGCSTETQSIEEMPQDELHQKLSESPDQDPVQPPVTPSQSAELSTVQLATQVGVVLAAELGFEQSQQIGPDQLRELAKAPTDTLNDVVVLPAQCAQPLEKLNWSPAQLGTEVARTDFTTAGGHLAGSIEVAELDEREALEEHFRTVLEMRTSCRSMKLNWVEFTETLNFENPEIDGVESQLYYTRHGNSETAQDTMVLIQSTGEHVVMVSFISGNSLADEKFKTVAKKILDTVLSQL